MLGRFVYALNLFCKDRYGMDYAVGDYWIYEFAKVGLGGGLRRVGNQSTRGRAGGGGIACAVGSERGHGPGRWARGQSRFCPKGQGRYGITKAAALLVYDCRPGLCRAGWSAGSFGCSQPVA